MPESLRRLLCNWFGHIPVPLFTTRSRTYDCLVCLRCRENLWMT